LLPLNVDGPSRLGGIILCPVCSIDIRPDRPVQALPQPLVGDIHNALVYLLALVDNVSDDNREARPWAKHPESIAMPVTTVSRLPLKVEAGLGDIGIRGRISEHRSGAWRAPSRPVVYNQPLEPVFVIRQRATRRASERIIDVIGVAIAMCNQHEVHARISDLNNDRITCLKFGVESSPIFPINHGHIVYIGAYIGSSRPFDIAAISISAIISQPVIEMSRICTQSKILESHSN